MSNARKTPAPEDDPTIQTTQDVASPLQPYQSAIADLAAAREKVSTLREIEVSLRTEFEQLEASREGVLSESITVRDTEASVESLMRLNSKLEIHKRKIEDLAVRIQGAEGELSRATSATLSQFQGLYRSFYAWNFEAEKAKLAEQLVPGAVAGHIVELVTHHSKTLQAIRQLEPSVLAEPEGLLAQGGRLLESVSSADGFTVPSFIAAAPGGPVAEWVGLPYADRGMSVAGIEAEILRIRTENPSLDLAATYRRMKELHPELFTPPVPDTVFAQEAQRKMEGMVGDTYESAEEQFSHAR